MTAIYAKLKDGSWGVRVPGTVTPGQSVTVTTKAGAQKVETVARVIWAGNGVSLCSVGKSAPGAGGSGARPPRRESGYCGYPCPVSGRRCSAKNGPCHDCI